MIKHLTKEDNLEDILKGGSFLVDFYADWCGPCKMISPILEEITEIDIIKINVDEHQDIAQSYGVMSIPTLIFFENSKEVKKEIGFKNKDEILNLINR